MLDWRLQEGRSYRISCAIEVSSEVSAPPPNPKFFALGQLERETLAFSFLPKTHDQPMFLGVWGQTQPEPTGAAGLLLGLPSLAPSAERTLRITLAVL